MPGYGDRAAIATVNSPLLDVLKGNLVLSFGVLDITLQKDASHVIAVDEQMATLLLGKIK